MSCRDGARREEVALAAVRYDGTNAAAVAAWLTTPCGRKMWYEFVEIGGRRGNELRITTARGTFWVEIGDRLVRTPTGRYLVRPSDYFEAQPAPPE